jgi:hypothetical protein
MVSVLEEPTPREKPYAIGKYIQMLAGYQLKPRDGRMLLATDWTVCHLNSSALNVPELPGRVL